MSNRFSLSVSGPSPAPSVLRATPMRRAAMLMMAMTSAHFAAQAQVTGTSGANGTNYVNCVGGSGCGNGYGVVPSASAAGAGGTALTLSGTQTNSVAATGGAGGNGGNNTTAATVFGVGPPGAPGGAGGDGGAGTGFTLTNDGSGALSGGAGGSGGMGAGGASVSGAGGPGGAGGTGLSGTGFTLDNAGAVTGGAGGAGGTGSSAGTSGTKGTGGTGGAGGAGVSGSTFSLTNTGTISGGNGGAAGTPGAGGPAGLAGVGGAGVVSTGGATIGNAGTISGAGTASAISLSGGGNTVTLQAASVLNGGLVSTSGSTNGGDTVNLVNGAQINGDLSLLAGSTLQTGSATITGNLSNGGATVAAAGANVVVGGNFSATGGFTTAVASMSSYGHVTATGTATLGGALHVDALNASGLVSGNLGPIISASSISGTFASTDTNSLLFTFAPVYSSTAVNLTVTSVLPLVQQTTNAQGNTPASGAAGALDQILADAPTGEIAQKFMAFSTGQEVALSNAVTQTLPSLIGGSILATQATLSGINRVVQSRLDGPRGMSSGDNVQSRHAWVKPFGSWLEQDSQGAVAGYQADTVGIVAGVDSDWSTSTRLGVGLAYARSRLESRSSVIDHKTDVDLWQLIGYGSHALDERTALNFQIDVGHNSNTSDRLIGFASSVASADYESNSAHVGAGLARSFTLSDKLTLIPTLRADYTWVRDSGYAETGAGALGLVVDSRNAQAFVISAGARAAYKVNDRVTLSASGALAYDTVHDSASVNAAFAGAPGATFTTYGISTKPLTAQYGLGVAYSMASGVELTAGYDAEQRSGFRNQTASVKVRWRF
ncbi:MAG: autotransporter outer membrane beta-barrel domain-containing protein [Rubrivivax sp.]|nr:MAG: autotransporter outer membrane beta-barrel domain-containing protein [Rubrivivax sp.]